MATKKTKIKKWEKGTNKSVSEDKEEESSKDNTSSGNNGFVTKLLDILKKFKKLHLIKSHFFLPLLFVYDKDMHLPVYFPHFLHLQLAVFLK